MERDQASKFVNDLLRLMISRNGSDLFITADFPPAIKVDGKITPVSNQTLTTQHTAELALTVNRELFATEIVRILIGSIGLILAVPITTFLSVYLLMPKGKKNLPKEELQKEEKELEHFHHTH